MKGLPYYQRILSAYLGRGRSQLSFWHETPQVNEEAFEPDSKQYFMTFEQKARYAGPFDDNDIPMLDYRGKIGKQYNPIAIAQHGLGCLNLHAQTKNSEWLEKAKVDADWMVIALKKNNSGISVWTHNFDWEYYRTLKAPWYSGLAQGQGISFLLRMYFESKEQKYLDCLQQAFNAMFTPVAKGGCLFVDDNANWWIEEYITEPPTHILNGFLWALWGVHDYIHFTDNKQAKELWERSLETLSRHLPEFDCGFWSCYDLAPTAMRNVASPFYHKLHLVQLDVMARLTGMEIFKEFHARWDAYQNNSYCRTRAFWKKASFKLLYF